MTTSYIRLSKLVEMHRLLTELINSAKDESVWGPAIRVRAILEAHLMPTEEIKVEVIE